MKTTKEIRLDNLRRLVNEAGSQTELADRLGHGGPSMLSQILGPSAKRGIGDQLARRLEKAGSKPYGWLDQIHSDAPPAAISRHPNALSDTAIRVARILDHLSPEQREHVIALMDTLGGIESNAGKDKRRR